MKIGLFGRGRMGSAIAAEALSRPDGVELAWQQGREWTPPSPVDCVIDVSVGAAVAAHLEWAATTGTPIVIGATGWDRRLLESEAAGRTGILLAPNFSLTVAFFARMTRLLGRFAALSEDRDPYLVEHHHARKKDAPSGTAKLLAQVLLEACPRKKRWVMPPDEPALDPQDLSVSAIRAGTTFSSHVIGIDSPGEVLKLEHEARSLQPYARGAIAAARWLKGKRGLHTMDEVAAEILDPVFGADFHEA